MFISSRELILKIYKITRINSFEEDIALKNQMRRASVSVLSNIAEGFERGSNAEFIQYLYISKGSCGEIRAQMTVALDLNYITQSIYDELTISCRRVSGMLANLVTHLKNSEYRGTKYRKIALKAPHP
jgi:four helix bundle protein